MFELKPDHRATALLHGDTEPEGDLEVVYVSLQAKKTKKKPKDAELRKTVEYAQNIYDSKYKKEVLEAFLLTRIDPKEVEDLLRIPVAVTNAYQHLFFDLVSFRDELSVEEYVRTYPDDFGRELKITAISLGSDFLKYRFDRGKSNVDFKQALTNLVETSYIIARAAKLNPIDSKITREARQWMATSIKALEAYAKIKPSFEGTDDEFKLVLQSIDANTKKRGSKSEKDSVPEGLKPEDILKG